MIIFPYAKKDGELEKLEVICLFWWHVNNLISGHFCFAYPAFARGFKLETKMSFEITQSKKITDV